MGLKGWEPDIEKFDELAVQALVLIFAVLPPTVFAHALNGLLQNPFDPSPSSSALRRSFSPRGGSSGT